MTEAHDTDWSVVGVHKKRAPNHSQRVDLRSTIADDSIINPHRNSVPILLYDMSRDKQEQAIPRYIARRVDIPPQQLDMKVVSVYSPNPHPTKDNLTSEDTSIDERSKLNVDCPEAQLAPLTQRNRSKPKQSTQSQLHIVTAFPPLALPALAIPLILLVCQISVLIGTLVPNHLPKRVVVACVCLVVIPNSFAVALVLKRGIYTTTLAMHAVIWPSIVLMFFMPFTPVLMTSHLLFSALLLLYIMRLRQSMFIFLCSL